MFRRTRIIGIVGVALVLVPSAFAKGQPAEVTPQWQQALMVRSEGLNQRYEIETNAPGVVGERFQQAPQWQQALSARSEALNRQHGLGAYAGASVDARERALTERPGPQVASFASLEAREQALTAKRDAQLATTSYPDWFERAAATAIRDNRGVFVADDRFDLHPQDVPATVTATSSGREIDVPQIGIGLGLGLLLALGLYLAMRFTRIRPVAH